MIKLDPKKFKTAVNKVSNGIEKKVISPKKKVNNKHNERKIKVKGFLQYKNQKHKMSMDDERNPCKRLTQMERTLKRIEQGKRKKLVKG